MGAWAMWSLCWLVGASGTIVVHPDSVVGPVNRRVLGENDLGYQWNPQQPKRVEYSNRGGGVWDPDAAAPVPELVAMAKEAGVTTLRWPGGCDTHRFEWKKTIGPADARPNQRFGLHEFLVRCQAVGAQPILSVAEYVGTPADAADLVEYLNAPVGANPNGGEDYAAIRAAQGHPAPWGVSWFEFGNESDHGDHHDLRYTPVEYATRYKAYRQAMRAVDPTIRLGLVLSNTQWKPAGTWTEKVLTTAPEADFLIHHAYLPGYGSNDGKETPAQLFTNGFAVDAQVRANYRYLDAQVQQLTGRRIPFAITEFNGAFVQERPYPYRLTHGNALVAGLLLTALLDPALPIDQAQYWQFANEYWGSVKGYAAPYVARPAHLMFSLYQRHLGTQIVRADTTCGTFDVPGGWGVRRMVGPARLEERELGEVPLGPWQLSQGKEYQERLLDGDVLEVKLTEPGDFNFYHASRVAPAEGGATYRLTAELKVEGLNPVRGGQLQIGDARGWNATHSSALSDMVPAGDWTPVRVDYQCLPDATGVAIQARRLEGGGGRGTILFRNLKLVRYEPESLGAQPLLTTLATRQADGTISLLVFNKSLTEPMDLSVEVPGGRTATAESLVAPALESTNERDPQTVKVVPVPAVHAGDNFRLQLSPFSLTGVLVSTK